MRRTSKRCICSAASPCSPDSGWQAGENGVRFGDRFRLCAPATDLDPQDITVQGFPFFHGAMRLKRTITVQEHELAASLCGPRPVYARICKRAESRNAAF